MPKTSGEPPETKPWRRPSPAEPPMPRRPLAIAPGSVVFGPNAEKYVVVGALAGGSGSFGKVFVVAREGSDEEFALKIPLDENESPVIPASIRNEGQLAVMINDPNVIRVYYFHDGLRHEGLPPYIIMELADGGSLEGLIGSRRESERNFTAPELTELLLQLARGMKAVNAKLVHRDVRPCNVLIHRGLLKIADFSLAKTVYGPTRLLTFRDMANARYLAPEAWSGLCSATVQMDMYSVGIIFYELIALRHPYSVHQRGVTGAVEWRKAHVLEQPKSPDTLNPEAPGWMAALTLKLMAKRPEERFSSWDEVIDRLVGGQDGTARGASVDPHLAELVNMTDEAKQRELRARQLAEAKDEREKLVRGAFTIIIGTLDNLADDFNRASAAGQMSVDADLDSLRANLTGPLGRLACQCHVATDDMRLRGQKVLAWGIVALDSACDPPRGLNLALVCADEADELGSWVTLEHHRWLRGHEYSKSFALQEAELRKRLEAIDATGRVETETHPFSQVDVSDLLSGSGRPG